jgi:tetratricopeptide (TPR) repeat protein
VPKFIGVKKQWLIVIAGAAAILGLFLFGNTVSNKTISTPVSIEVEKFDIQQFIAKAKQKLTPNQSLYLAKIENSITRGDLPTQQITVNNSLANFWKDSAKVFEPYAYYLSESAKLDNSEKNLTFAAQLMLASLRGEHDEVSVNWKADQAIQLFEQAIKINPTNDELTIGLASCYIFGKGRNGATEETMQKGVLKVLDVVKKDSTNMKAQLVLGIGGFISGQYDKAIVRLQKVVAAQPSNLEAVAFLADTYAAKGDKVNAIKWYEASKQIAKNPSYDKEVNERIKQL